MLGISSGYLSWVVVRAAGVVRSARSGGGGDDAADGGRRLRGWRCRSVVFRDMRGR